MQSVSQGIADAFVADEVCPLCLDRYAAVDECTCIVCHAPSCPGCAELLDAHGTMRCYACAPVAHSDVSGVRPAFVWSDAEPPNQRRRSFYRALSALYSSGLRSLKKPIEALSTRIFSRSKSAVMTPVAERSSSLSLSPR